MLLLIVSAETVHPDATVIQLKGPEDAVTSQQNPERGDNPHSLRVFWMDIIISIISVICVSVVSLCRWYPQRYPRFGRGR